MSDGVALDELLTAVREAMRDLNVDSTMLGEVVHAVGSTDGRFDFGAHIPVTDDLPCVSGFAAATLGTCQLRSLDRRLL